MELTTLDRLALIPNLINAEDAVAAANEFLSAHIGNQLATGDPVHMLSAVRSTWIVPIQSFNPQSGVVENIGVIAVDEETGRVTGWTPIEQIKEANHQSITQIDAKKR